MTNSTLLVGRAYYIFFILTVGIRIFRAMMSLALYMVTDVITHNITTAGMVGCTCAVGNALSAVIMVRLFSLCGIAKTLYSALLIFCVSGYFLYQGLMHNEAALLYIATAFFGVFYPMCDTIIRYQISSAIPLGPLRDRAFNWDALSYDLAFTISPGIAAVLSNTAYPIIALLVAVVGIVIFTVFFVNQKSVRNLDSIEAIGNDKTYAVPLLVWLIIIGQLVFLSSIGALELMIQNIGEDSHHANWVGIILSFWAFASVVGALSLARFFHPRNKLIAYCGCMAVMGISLLPAAFIGSWSIMSQLWMLLLLMGLNGLPFAYSVGLTYSLLDDTFPDQTPAKYFAWMSTAPALGYAVGLFSAGHMAKYFGSYISIGVAGVVLVLIALISWLYYVVKKFILRTGFTAVALEN